MYDAVTSYCGQFLVVTCQIFHDKTFVSPGLVVISFDRTLKLIGESSLRGLDPTSSPHRVKRLHGTDIYAVAAGHSVSIVKIDFNRMTMDRGQPASWIEEVYTIRNIHDSAIDDFDFWGNLMFSVSQTDPDIKITQFDFREPTRHPKHF